MTAQPTPDISATLRNTHGRWIDYADVGAEPDYRWTILDCDDSEADHQTRIY